MFYKKKIMPVGHDTPDDIKLKDIERERCEAIYSLQERAEKVIICNGAIDLYPEGADKEKAKADAEKAKHLLLCAIGHYDDLVRQYKEVCASPDRNTTAYYGRTIQTSHELIERAYKDFYKRK
jgi:hypothetical protein